eukprot:77121_1
MGIGSSVKEFADLPALHIQDKYFHNKQVKLDESSPALHKESLEHFEARQGAGLPARPGYVTRYTYIVLLNGEVRYANLLPLDGNYGHTSLLPDSDYAAAYNPKTKGVGTVKYAGQFRVSADGTMTYIDNDSGHFMPFKAHKAIVAKALGVSAEIFHHPEHSRAHQEMMNALKDKEYDDEYDGFSSYGHYDANNYGINYENEYGQNQVSYGSYANVYDGGAHNQLGHSGGYTGGYHNIQGYDAGNGIILVAVMMIFMLFCIIFACISCLSGAILGYGVHSRLYQKEKKENEAYNI